jgi:hypothetical protein
MDLCDLHVRDARCAVEDLLYVLLRDLLCAVEGSVVEFHQVQTVPPLPYNVHSVARDVEPPTSTSRSCQIRTQLHTQ